MLCQLPAAASGRSSPDASGASPAVVEGPAPRLYPERRGGALAAALASFLLPSGCFLFLPLPGLAGVPPGLSTLLLWGRPCPEATSSLPGAIIRWKWSGLWLAGLPLLGLQVNLLPTPLLLPPAVQVGF